MIEAPRGAVRPRIVKTMAALTITILLITCLLSPDQKRPALKVRLTKSA
jgi:hypothetical protein